MADRQDEISTLNTLIVTLIDSINGYEDAAASSEGGRFPQMFRDRANERQRVVEDLRAEVRRLGGEPEQGGSFMGRAHQSWVDLSTLAVTIVTTQRQSDHRRGRTRRGLSQTEVRNGARQRQAGG